LKNPNNNEILTINNNLSALTLNPQKYIKDIKYQSEDITDEREYKDLEISSLSALLKFVPYILICLFLLIAGLIIYKILKNRKNRYDYYDDYY